MGRIDSSHKIWGRDYKCEGIEYNLCEYKCAGIEYNLFDLVTSKRNLLEKK